MPTSRSVSPPGTRSTLSGWEASLRAPRWRPGPRDLKRTRQGFSPTTRSLRPVLTTHARTDVIAAGEPPPVRAGVFATFEGAGDSERCFDHTRVPLTGLTTTSLSP